MSKGKGTLPPSVNWKLLVWYWVFNSNKLPKYSETKIYRKYATKRSNVTASSRILH